MRFYSEIAAPFYFLNDKNEPQGANFDLAQALITQADLQATVEHMPWARAVYEVTNHPDVVLLSVLKTAKRQNQFQWLGRIHSAKASLMSLESRKDIQITSIEQAKQLRVGTIRGYGSATYLQDNGFIEHSNLTLVANSAQLWTMLFKKRIDLVLSNPSTAKYEIMNADLSANGFKSIYQIDALSVDLQMATGKMTSEPVVNKLKAGIETLKASGEYSRIMQKWSLN